MGISIGKVFSILVASGNGQQCNTFKAALREELCCEDEKTGMPRVVLFKDHRKDPALGQDSLRIAKEVGKIAMETVKSIPNYFYGPDLPRDLSKLN